MQKLTLVCAVAALAAAALPFPANAYCRGCVIEQPADGANGLLALASHAEAPPIAIQSSCHVEKQKRVVNGRVRWRRIEICE